MTLSRFNHVVVVLAAFGFAVIAIGMWIAPDEAARRLGLVAVDAAGRATVRADLAGLFAGLAVLCALAAWTRQRSWRIAAALLLALVAVGRIVEWLASGGANLNVGALAIELGLAAAVIGTWPENARSPGHAGIAKAAGDLG
jgi:hypothetical protein